MGILNPQILPGSPVRAHDHKKQIIMALVVTGFAILIGLIYWFVSTKPAEEIPDTGMTHEQMLGELFATGHGINVPPMTQEQLAKEFAKVKDVLVPELSETEKEALFSKARAAN